MSMDFTASKYDAEQRMYSWVFPHEWMQDGDWNDDTGEFTENPNYRPDLNLNLSNGNMRDVLGTLGYSTDDEGFAAPIDEFIGRATAWLRQAIGKQSAEEPDVVEKGGTRGGELDLTLLKPRKFEEFKAAELANRDVLATIRRVWDRLEKSNSVLPGQTWESFRDRWIERRAQQALDRWERDEKSKHSYGPTMIHVGKPAGYYNERISRMVRIAREGKAMGATHVTAA